MAKKILPGVVLFLSFVSALHAQHDNPQWIQSQEDSLIALLQNPGLAPARQLILYEELGILYNVVNPDKSLRYCKKALTIAEKIKNTKKSSDLCGGIAMAYDVKMMYDSAYYFHEKAMDYALKSNNSQSMLDAYMFFAYSYYRQSLYAKSLEYGMKHLALAESLLGTKEYRLGHHRVALANIGSLYRELGNSEKALYYLKKAEELGGPRVDTNHDLGLIYLELGDYEKALEYEFKAIEEGRKGYRTFEVYALQAVARIYLATKDHEQAARYAEESYRIAVEILDLKQQAKAWAILSDVYREQQRWPECEALAVQAWTRDSAAVDTGPMLAYNIALANVFLGNKTKAAEFFRKYNEINKKLHVKTFQESIAGMEIEYETEKKKTRIATLEREKKFYISRGVIAALMSLLVFGLLFYRHRLNVQKRKLAEQQHELAEQKIKQLEQEKQIVATQAMLDGETAERSRLARDLHDGLGGMLSVVKLNLKEMKSFTIIDHPDVMHFDKALNMLDESIGELRRIAHHMMPDTLMRYGLRVSLEDFCRAIPDTHFQYIGDNKRLDSRLEVMLYRCAYELVNNVVKHAHATNINIQLMIDNSLVSLTVHDNGVGFDPSAVSSGAGLENIRTRVSAYNGKLHIHSAPGQGTEVSIEIE